MYRTWLPLIVLVIASLAGDALTRSQANAIDRERELQAATAAIRNLPTNVGPWQATPGDELADETLRMLQCRAHASLVFVNAETGERVSIILIAGAAGPLVAQTPATCHKTGAFEIVEPAQSDVIASAGGLSDTFERLTFRPKSAGQGPQCVYHAWRTSQGRWVVPQNPCLTLGGAPMLYKLQLTTRLPEQTADSDACHRFLEAFIPALDTALNPLATMTAPAGTNSLQVGARHATRDT